MYSYHIKAGHLVIFFIAVSLVLFFPVSYTHLFDWDEINFAESSREMLLSGNFVQVQINFEPFMEKPPLFFWLQVLSYHVFGINEYAARFPNAFFGLLSVICLFLIGKKVHNSMFGLLWAAIYIGSFLPFIYSKSGIIDPVFNFFIFISLYFLIRSEQEIKSKHSAYFALFSGLFAGLAIITKGPVALLLIALTVIVFWGLKRFKKMTNFRDILIFSLSTLLTTFAWYGYETVQNGPGFLLEFVQYQIELFSQPVAGHKQPFYYHFAIVLLGCFPMSLYALPILFKRNLTDPFQFKTWMAVLFWVVLILFSLSSTKIAHYSSMCYLPLSYLAALHVYNLHKDNKILGIGIWISLLILGLLFSLVFVALPYLIENSHLIEPLIQDKFALASLEGKEIINLFLKWLGVVYGILFILIMMTFMRKQLLKGVVSLSVLNVVFLSIYLHKVVPEIEAITQRPAIEFFKELKGQDVYVNVIGYKSYAHYFYFEQPIIQDTHKKELDWQLNGDIDKPVYLVTRIDRLHEVEPFPQLKEIKRKGGFVLFVREVEKTDK
jgi:4-amino-4-deoxy-L-arabinose transferase-like glycosyltransferase